MENNYWISVWAKLRQAEVIRIPQDYSVHTDFSRCADEDEIRSAFAQINALYKNIYNDVAEQPEIYGLPLHPKDQYRTFSQQWRDSGQASYRPFILLYNLFICGEMKGSAVSVSIEKYKNLQHPQKFMIEKKIKQPHLLFNALKNYGFVFEGLKNNKPTDSNIIVSYPENDILLRLFKQIADKAHNTNRIYDFLCCHFRLLQDGIDMAKYGFNVDDVCDRVNTDEAKEFVCKMDKALIDIGMLRIPSGGFECRGLAYYHKQKDIDTKKPYSYRIVTRNTDIEHNIYDEEPMMLMLRIRNVEKCKDYLNSCPDSVKKLFTVSDNGCGAAGHCGNGISYEINGVNYRKCGCCFPTFRFKPQIKDIPHYIKLIELGEKK